MKTDKIECNIGFAGRIFLTKSEWETYKRRTPVRYIKKKKPILCEVCNEPSTKDNPFQNSHRIGFSLGIIYLGLTPEYVDRDENIVSAHRKKCNNKAELNLMESCKNLKSESVISLPEYLPIFVKKIWNQA